MTERQNAQLVTRYIKYWADTTEFERSGSLQTLYRFDSETLRIAQLFILQTFTHFLFVINFHLKFRMF
jgi:hypothetical protein